MEWKQKEWRGQKVWESDFAAIYDGFPFYYYDIKTPPFIEDEAQLVNSLSSVISGKWNVDEIGPKNFFPKGFSADFMDKIIKPVTYNEGLESLMPVEDFSSLKLSLLTLIAEYFPKMKNHSAIAEYILANSVGYGKISPLIEDPDLEEIMVNGYERPVFVFHKKYGHCRTNAEFSVKKDLDDLLQKVAKTVGKKFDADHPLLDARLPDGNRANATFSFVTPFGPSLTIRKFTKVPLTIIDLIDNNTFSSELAAFMWVMIEGLNIEPMNIIITGGTGVGKTCTLNALASFIRYPERVISIEDTLELQLGSRKNWVQMEARPRLKGQEGVSMDDLLKNALRMRPDRIIVGEVRGPEAQTLFVAMDTGHKGILGTLHSNSAKEMLLRLKSEPMNVPESLVPLLNLVLVQSRIYVKGRGVERRVHTVTELSSMAGKPLFSNIYERDRKSDDLRRIDVPIGLMESLSEKTGRSKKEIDGEISIRRRVLEWMLKNDIREQSDVEMVVQQYYYDPEQLLQKVLSDISS